jgi:AraC-like DNA-binding protein
LSRSRSAALQCVKDFVERHLTDPTLDTAMVVAGTGFSARYINDLLNDNDTSLMRYILQRRLERCSKDLLNLLHTNHNISEIALNWGFNDLSHFSRTFKQRYGCTPKQYRQDSRLHQNDNLYAFN